jgi:hypothetical protein
VAWSSTPILTNYVLKAGDTMTGDLTILKTTSIAQDYPATLNFSVK